jgi:hypothetical protein
VAQIQTKSWYWAAPLIQDMRIRVSQRVLSLREHLSRIIRRVMRFNKSYMQQFLCKYQDVQIYLSQRSSKGLILTGIENKQKKIFEKKSRENIFPP